jgi:hypothetical protein
MDKLIGPGPRLLAALFLLLSAALPAQASPRDFSFMSEYLKAKGITGTVIVED